MYFLYSPQQSNNVFLIDILLCYLDLRNLIHRMLLLLVLFFPCSFVYGVVSPLDKVTEDLKEMKETINSVQASLITSVSLIQGKMQNRHRFVSQISLKSLCHIRHNLSNPVNHQELLGVKFSGTWKMLGLHMKGQ